jgi:TPP-dependent trihydroxycyclohexane-1,2-dione (THcHDO) dehydratase
MPKLKAARNLVRYLAAQQIATDDDSEALFGGIWPIPASYHVEYGFSCMGQEIAEVWTSSSPIRRARGW